LLLTPFAEAISSTARLTVVLTAFSFEAWYRDRAWPRDLSHPGNPQSSPLALQGTHLGPLHFPRGMLPPTGKRMDGPCCDVVEFPRATTRLTRTSYATHVCQPRGPASTARSTRSW